MYSEMFIFGSTSDFQIVIQPKYALHLFFDVYIGRVLFKRSKNP